jgi:hypothetical protein
MIVDIIGVVASATQDPSVSDEAARTLSRSKSPRVAEILSMIARNRSTPELSKDSAYVASQAVAIRAVIEQGIAVFYSTQPGGKAFEDSSLRHGVFTYFLLDALRSERDVTSDRKLNLESLSSDIGGKTSKYTEEKLGQTLWPIFESNGAKVIPLSKVGVLAIGVSKYTDKNIPGLQFARDDAGAVASLFHEEYGAEVRLLLDEDATSFKVLATLNELKSKLDSDSTFIFYYAGHGWNVNGEQYLAGSDVGIASHPPASERIDPLKRLRDSYTRDRELFFQLAKPPLNGIGLQGILKDVTAFRSRYKLFFVDACATTLN